MCRLKIVTALSASAFFLASCVSPPSSTTGGSSPATVSIPGGSPSTGGSSGTSGSTGGGTAGAGLPGAGLPGIPSGGVGLPGGTSGGTSPGGSTSGSPGGSSSGSPDGSESGSPDGSDTGSDEGVAGADGSGSFDLPSWEPSPSSGSSDSSENGSDSSSSSGGGDPGFSEADLEELEKTLDEAIGTFDGEILREQENARDKTGNVGSAGGQSQVETVAGVGEFETYGGGNGSAPGATDGSSDGSGSSEQTFKDGPPPSPDDDIVARQIREAASREQDPEQRAILWEEYDRYKNGI